MYRWTVASQIVRILCLIALNNLGIAAITSKIKHARLAQLLQPSLAFCFSLQPMTADRPGLDGTPSLAAS